jgi:hypothetical protein
VMYVQTVEIRLLSTNSYLFLGVNLPFISGGGGTAHFVANYYI